MAKTGLLQDQRFQQHLSDPECPERLVAIAERLETTGLADSCVPIEPKPIETNRVHMVHDAAYIDRLARACREGKSFIDVPDSAICRDSLEIAELAAGGVLVAIDQVMGSNLDNAFCAVRPPGHHAERHMSMGFCLLNNVAIAARHLLDRHGLERVLILDWDVHHGNGTQHIFESDEQVLFISLHGHPQFVYPGTGYENETGRGAGEGYTINLPMSPGSVDDDYRKAFDQKVLPAIERYAPQFVLISAGFDAHALDPLAPLNLQTESFGWMTDRLTEVAVSQCRGHLVSILEGGYDLDALADSVALHVSRLLAV